MFAPSSSTLHSTITEISLQNASIDIWETKYRLKTKNGDAVDQDIDATYQRVAKALAAVEKTQALQKKYYQDFLWVLRQGAIPAGRIISNAGAQKHKPATSTINCFAYETPVLTDKGVFPIGELANKKKTVNVLNGNGNWSSVMFESHGKQAVHTLAFKYADNKAISKVRATKNHRWILKSGSVITSEFWLTTSKLNLFREITHVLPSLETDNGAVRSKVWTFVNISDSVEMEEVYCCTEPETGSFCLFHGLLTGNCTVSGVIEDSMDDILGKVHEAGLTLKAGCGIGYEFSTLRPKDAYVSGAGAYTSGPLSFMDIYDKMCFTVSSAGGRRGAQMATFDICHPDVIEFIRAKREDGRLRQFNLSLLITSEFIEAVKNKADWPLSFPVTEKEVKEDNLDLNDAKQIIWRDLPETAQYVNNSDGLVACRIIKTIPAQRLWDIIMSSTYDYAEPGFILIDKVNEMNNNWYCENIRATNPCGEQALPPYGSCLLGSINLTRFIKKPFTDESSFDWDLYRKTIRIFTRMLDNVVEINGLPLEKQREEIISKRRHGMGYLGLGSTVTMLGMKYGDEQSLIFTDEVTKMLAIESWKEGLSLAKEKGTAPILEKIFTVTGEMLHKRPEMLTDGYKVGDEIAGKVLHAKYSRYMQKIAEDEPELIAELIEIGARFTHATSIAPTGTISLSLANNASNGIEPSFAHHYARNVIREGKKSKEKVDVYSFELLAYRALINPEAMPYSEDPAHKLPDYFISADNVSPKQHVDVQAAAQKWIDSSISKTANVPTDYPYEDFKDIYQYAYEKGLKGCTTFRFNPEVFQGVLVKEADLENTTYQFTLEDGAKVELKGNEEVEYDGEMHSAANLFDALKEGYYGKF